MYVVYDPTTTILFGNETGYRTVAAAKAARTRMGRPDMAVAEKVEFHRSIEKMEEKVNLMSGKTFKQPKNTPLCCDPSSETYWCM